MTESLSTGKREHLSAMVELEMLTHNISQCHELWNSPPELSNKYPIYKSRDMVLDCK